MRTALLLALSACTTRIQVDDPQTPDAPEPESGRKSAIGWALSVSRIAT